MAVELAHLVLVAHRDQPDPRVTQVLLALPDLRAMLANADQKALGVFRVLLGLRGIMVFLVPLERTGNPDPRVIMVQLDPLDLLGHRALQDLLESVVPPVRMRLPLSWIST